MTIGKTEIRPWCWVGTNGVHERGRMPPCDGHPVKAHLIKQQVLLRELPAEVAVVAIGDPRVMVKCCGGPMGNGGHHGMLDHSKRIRIPPAHLPTGLWQFALDYDSYTRTGHALTAWLEREYGRAS